ncbi:colorectal mutant cancer protein [Biomphalaria glabrata]|nr:colorectal mutant cancer protein-like [Biomphalaria glabrata]
MAQRASHPASLREIQAAGGGMPTQGSGRQMGGQETFQKPTLLHACGAWAGQRDESVGEAVCSPTPHSFPADKAFGMPTVRKCLVDAVVTKLCDPTWLLLAARETIASYPAGVSTIYTDGSVQTLEGTVRAEYGAVVRLSGNPESLELSGPCHGKSSTEAELEAMLVALEWVAKRV